MQKYRWVFEVLVSPVLLVILVLSHGASCWADSRVNRHAPNAVNHGIIRVQNVLTDTNIIPSWQYVSGHEIYQIINQQLLGESYGSVDGYNGNPKMIMRCVQSCDVYIHQVQAQCRAMHDDRMAALCWERTEAARGTCYSDCSKDY